MYICNDCGSLLRDEEDFRNVPASSDEPGWSECAHCGSDDYSEAKQCDLCEEYFSDRYTFCPECSEYLLKELKKAIEDHIDKASWDKFCEPLVYWPEYDEDSKFMRALRNIFTKEEWEFIVDADLLSSLYKEGGK